MLEEDRFKNNLILPISENFLTEKFLEDCVRSEQKKKLLTNLKLARSQLLGAAGHNRLHIFDKTTRMWITSNRKLGLR